jgi:parallel beta-helix repeat protein
MNIERNLRLRRRDVDKRLTSIGIVCLVVVATFVGFINFESEVVSAGNVWYVGSGAGNQSTTINGGISLAVDGDTVFVYSGTYVENVVVDKTITLTGEDRDTTIIVGGGVGDVVRIVRDWVNVSGFTVTNANAGISLLAVQNCRVFNNLVFTNDIQGISLSNSRFNNITGNTVSNNFDGIFISSSSNNNTVAGNNISDNDQYGISLLGSSWNNITGNTISNNEIGINLGTSDNNRIIKNNISLNDKINGKVGIQLFGSVGNTLKSNAMINNGIWIGGVLVEHWNTHNIDTSNTVNGKPVQYWKNRTGGKVPAGAGQVILANCTNVRVEGQELTYGTVGIELGFSSNNSITGNNASSNHWSGIYLYNSNGNNIFGNNASLYNSAISLDYSNKNNIIGNMVFSNEIVGIVLFYSNANQIIDNTISFNGWYGIYLQSTALNNTIFHNNFIDNTFQAADDTNNGNQWDNGYPDGGNFWSDFDEQSEGAYDDFKGPDQNVTGSDGIVDNGTIAGGGKNPYVIGPDSQDNYPLIYFVEYPFLFLYEGWNLISIPRIQSDTNLGTVLSSISGSYDAVQWYNVSDNSDHWKHNHISKPSNLNDLDSIHHTKGFWIHITEPGGILFDYSGVQPTENQSINLYKGWNLVGYPSLSNKNRTAALNNITFGNDVDSIWTYDAATQKWEEIGVSDYFELGRGYWIHSKVEMVWDVPL